MKENDLEERITTFVIDVVSLLQTMKSEALFTVIRNQLFRSCTSVGANYQEAQGGVSRADFNNRIHISLKEMRETHYWLVVMQAMVSKKNDTLIRLVDESDQIKRILGSIASKTQMYRK